MASSSAVGRRRGMINQSSTEDQALNMIAREAEARLAAKRAARAEARSIRMNELEKMQKEADEHMDKEYEKDLEDSPKKRIGSRIASSKKIDIGENQFGLDTQSVQFKELLRETEEKYRKAMVSIAQLDNEKQALQYQVDCLKDNVEDYEESLENITDELAHKTKEYNKLHKDYTDLQKEFSKVSDLLRDRERILDEHGINLDGTLKEENLEKTDGISESSTMVSNHLVDNTDDLHSEIERLRQEVKELKLEQDKCSFTNSSQKEADTIRQRAELERSFVDVSDEANAIQEERRHAGIFINNNEKCDEFEVIDNGSQQGGLHHFEDKSFELSVRSSLVSSGHTELASECESDFLIEISVDVEKINQRHDYEIIDNETDKSKKFSLLDIDHIVGHERTPSPEVKSDINVSKYLFFEENENVIDKEETKLNINQYFSTTDSNEVSNSVLNTNVIAEESFDTIENKDFTLTTHIEESRQSPYVELESDTLDYNNAVDVNNENIECVEAQTHAELFKCKDNIETVESLDTAFLLESEDQADDLLSNPIHADKDPLLSNLDSSHKQVEIPENDYETQDSILIPERDEIQEPLNMLEKDYKIQNPLNNSNECNEINETLCQVALGGIKPEDISINTKEEPVLCAEKVFQENEISVYSDKASSQDNITIISQEVIDLYEMSAGEALTPHTGYGTTFSGVTKKENSNDVTPEISVDAYNNTGDLLNKKGCLVRVECYSQATPQSPEIKEVNQSFDFKNGHTNSAHVSKDKKTKKKKKKSKCDEIKLENPSLESHTPPGLFAPEISMLGYSDSHLPQHRHSDIPQQFLEVSHGLGSVSDVSDTEESESASKRTNTKKQSKKDTCKNQ